MAAPLLRTRWSVRFNVISSSKERHPLHLLVGKNDFHNIVGPCEETNAIIALERGSSKGSPHGGGRLFAVLQPQVDIEASPREGENDIAEHKTNSLEENVYGEVILHCTERFLSHYGFTRDDNVYFTVPHSVTLEKVVVGVSSEKAFAWVKTTLFSRGLLLAVCQGKVLIRQNDNLLVPFSTLFSQDVSFTPDLFFDMKVLYCEPVCQGRLAVTTEIITMNQVMDTRMMNLCPTIQQDYERLKDPKSAKSKSALNAKTGENASVVEATVENTSTLDSSHGASIMSKMVVLDLREIPSAKDFLACCRSHSQQHSAFDVFGAVCVPRSQLERVGLVDGDVAEMFLYKPAEDKKHENGEGDGKKKKDDTKDKNKESNLKTKRMVIVKEMTETISQGCIGFASPCLRFNLCKKTTFSEGNQVCLKRPPETLKEVAPEELLDYGSGWTWLEGIPYATEMHISLVRSPAYATSTDASQMLREYFSKPRLTKKGDVLALSSKGDGDFCNELSDGRRSPVVYFRVIRVHPALPAIHTYWADIQHTVLFQDGALNHYIPGLMPMFLHGELPVLPPPGLMNVFQKLKSIIQPHLTHKHRPSDPIPSVLLTGTVGCGKKALSQSVAAALNLHFHVVNTYDLCGETSASAEARVKVMMTRVTSFAPCVLLLRNIHAFGKGADGNTEDPRTASSFHEIVRASLAEQNKHPVILLASTHLPKQVNADMYEGFLHQIAVPAPNETERREMVAKIAGNTRSYCNINKSRIAQRTAGFVLGDIYALVCHAHREAEIRIKEKCLTACRPGQRWQEEEDLVMAGVAVSQQDYEAALDRLQAAHSDNIGAPKIPKVSWADVGGLASVKADILDTIQLPLQHPELLAAGLRRSGVLLYGPPGTGKTLLAKAVATECSLNFMSVKGPELINMYVGQSEENIREVFHRARSAAPCVIFFDELDSLAPNRGRSGDSGGVMDRVVSQLLAELDGMNKSTDVFVIGATNRPDLLDPALLRPGRFDKLLYLGVSEDKQGQLKILTALTRKFHLTPGWSLSSVVELCPSNMTGADFYALCSDAMLNALKRKITLLEQGSEVDQERIEVDVEDFKEAVAKLVPSVSEAELDHYKYIQRQFNNQ